MHVFFKKIMLSFEVQTEKQNNFYLGEIHLGVHLFWICVLFANLNFQWVKMVTLFGGGVLWICILVRAQKDKFICALVWTSWGGSNM